MLNHCTQYQAQMLCNIRRTASKLHCMIFEITYKVGKLMFSILALTEVRCVWNTDYTARRQEICHNPALCKKWANVTWNCCTGGSDLCNIASSDTRMNFSGEQVHFRNTMCPVFAIPGRNLATDSPISTQPLEKGFDLSKTSFFPSFMHVP